MIGPGKYDAQLTKVLHEVGAKQGILIVFDGAAGPSFCAQLDVRNAFKIPFILKDVAKQMEKDYKEGKI